MNKHTPGPWEYRAPGGWVVLAGQPGVIAFVSRDENADPMRTEKERDANAHLIAAAPDLLEACKAMVHAIDDVTKWAYSGHKDKADQGRAAIAKAEGRE